MDKLIVLNFGHVLSNQAKASIEERYARIIERYNYAFEIRDIPVQLILDRSLVPQVEKIVAKVGLTPKQWKTEVFLIILPGHASAAAILLAAIHGRRGEFLAFAHMVKTQNGYDLGEVIDLDDVSDDARKKR